MRTSTVPAQTQGRGGLKLFFGFLVVCGLGAVVWTFMGRDGNDAPGPGAHAASAVQEAPPPPAGAPRLETARPEPAHTAVVATRPAVTSRSPLAPGANPAGKAGPVYTQVVKAKNSRGPLAVVRWNGPVAEGLDLLEAGRAEDALAWTKAHAQLLADNAAAKAQNQLLQARALLVLGRTEEAKALYAAEAEAKTSPETGADAAFGSALCAARGNVETIPLEVLKELLDKEPRSWGRGMAAFEYARRQEAAEAGQQERSQETGELAYAFYQKALFSNRLETPVEKVCLARLAELSDALILHPKVLCKSPKAVLHKIENGQTLSLIARRHDSSIGLLCLVNHLDPKKPIQAGRSLKVLSGPMKLQVDRFRLTATLTLDGQFLRRYPVCIGAGNATPSGVFSVRKKQVNPDWYISGRRIPFGDPENVLGTRWLGFDTQENEGRGAGLGVHGTTDPESIPGRESRGCIRLRNAEVEELYELFPHGGTVEIN
jgi:LysM repeat protein